MSCHLPATKEDPGTHSQKQGRGDPKKQPFPSSSSSLLSSATDAKLRNEKKYLQKRRQELRPLLNSIRLAESNSLRKGDTSVFNGSNSIGPLHISRQYHNDAWKQAPTFASASSWSRCRDLNHAENTVIAYWLKYCPEAVERHDFEVLTKVHNGGPQNLRGEKTETYWSEVSKHLKQEEMRKMKEKVLHERSPLSSKHCKVELSRSPLEKNSKQNESRKTSERFPSPLSSIITNTVSMHRTLRNGYNKLSGATGPNKLIQNMKPKFFHQTSQHETGKLKENVSPKGEFRSKSQKCSPLGVDKGSDKSAQKRLNHIKYLQSKSKIERVHTVGHVLANNDNSKLSENSRKGKEIDNERKKEKAALKIQAFWRMRCVRSQYRISYAAILLIQKMWRHHSNALFRAKNNSPHTSREGSKTEDFDITRVNCIPAEMSACQLLYRDDISPVQEDELLTELVKLFEWDTESSRRDSCHGFQFPQLEENNMDEVCTPKMKLNWQFSGTTCTEGTPLIIKEALPSPFMEKEIINELAKLFPRRLHLTPHKDMTPESSVCFQDALGAITAKGMDVSHGEDGSSRISIMDCSRGDEHLYGGKMMSILDLHVESNHLSSVITESCCPEVWGGNEEEELNPNATALFRDKSPDWHVESENIGNAVTGSYSEICNGNKEEELSPIVAISLQYQSPEWHVESDKRSSVTGSISEVSCDNEEENLSQIANPSLQDRSPEWHVEPEQTISVFKSSAFSSGDPSVDEEDLSQIAIPLLQDQSPVVKSKASRKRIHPNPCTRKVEKALISSLSSWQESKLDTSMDKVSSEGHQGLNVSSVSSVCSMRHSLKLQYIRSPQSEKGRSTKPLDDLNSHFVLETDDRDSTIYAKAIFQCMSISIDDAPWLSCEKSLRTISEERESERPLVPMRQLNPSSLQHLCMLWEKHNISLLTRSLKYKSLQTMNGRIHSVSRTENVSALGEVTDINAEILKLEELGEKSGGGGDFIIHQRNTIYSNIAGYCDMEEKHKLYTRWGMEKLFSGCLMKIVYELLWKDPQRYEESAELVLQYLL